MGRINRIVSIVGLLVFGGLLVLTALAPGTVERTARAFVLAEVRERLAPIIEKLCHFNCADRAALEAKVESDLRGALSATAEARGKIASANAAVFALLLRTTFLGPRAAPCKT